MTGRVVVLNGPSSAGKTTLAKATRKLLGQTAVVVGIDRLFSMAHPDHPLNWTLYEALTEATFGAAIGFARRGFSVMVDIVFERRTCFEIAERVLDGCDRQYVAVTCEVDELERRERARENRPAGLARRQSDSVLHDVRYALHIDTSIASTDESAMRVAKLFDATARSSPNPAR